MQRSIDRFFKKYCNNSVIYARLHTSNCENTSKYDLFSTVLSPVHWPFVCMVTVILFPRTMHLANRQTEWSCLTTQTHTLKRTLSLLTFSSRKWSKECKHYRNRTEIYICQFSDMLHLLAFGGKWARGQYCARAERRVSTVNRLFKILQQIYSRNKRRFGEEETWKEENDANKLQSQRLVKNYCSVSYLCSFWILQKMARSSTDVCLRSSRGETDPGRIVRDTGSILVSGAGCTAELLRQRRQEWRNHLFI
jgi:hypothetical protein